MKRAIMIVSGLVQGVGFRYVARNAARRCSLKGKIENLEDETVRIICEGEERDIERFAEAIRAAESPIEVEDIRTEYSEPLGQYKSFKIVLGDMLEELVEGHATGAMYLHDIRGKQDQMLDKQDQMLDKQDQMLDKQNQTVVEIRSLSSDIRSVMDSRFQRLEDEISLIKAKLSI